MERFLSPQDLSDVLAIPLKTIYDWNYRGAGPRALRVGRHVRYREGDVVAWLDARAEQSKRSPA